MQELNYKTLELTTSGMPVSIVSCHRALALIRSERAILREVYPDTQVRSSTFVTSDEVLKKSRNDVFVIGVPSVIQFTKSEYEPKDYTVELPFSRKNIYIRDHGRCQYCGKKVSISNFTFDHIIPQTNGGLTNWENVVVSCIRCNSQKDCKTLKRYHRDLIRKPRPLRIDKAAPRHIVSKLAAQIPHETWTDYIYWNVILEP